MRGLLRLSVQGATFRTNADITFACECRTVWCPKRGRTVVGGLVEARPKEIIDEVVEEKGRGWWS
ncbi:MAG: hypothetical protein ACRDTS_22175 [Mycobacterium sp.]